MRDDHRELVVRQIETQPEVLQVRVTPYNPETKALGLYRIDVEVPADAPSGDFMGARRGHIRIATDHPERSILDFDVMFAVTRS